MKNLTERQLQVVELLILGKTSKEMAKDLRITEKGVRGHLLNIYKVYEVNSRARFLVKYFNEKLAKFENEPLPKPGEENDLPPAA